MATLILSITHTVDLLPLVKRFKLIVTTMSFPLLSQQRKTAYLPHDRKVGGFFLIGVLEGAYRGDERQNPQEQEVGDGRKGHLIHLVEGHGSQKFDPMRQGHGP